ANGLANPPNYDGINNRYANATQDRAYKTFDLSTAGDAKTLEYQAYIEVANGDTFSANCKSAGGDPFSSGTVLQTPIYGSSDGSLVGFGFDLSSCASASTTIGFQMNTNATTNSLGAYIAFFDLRRLNLNSTTYNVISGTSMATPHVAGLAAMLFAYNPNFTYSDVAGSIINSGVSQTSLAGKSVSGKSVDAVRALVYINPPSNISVHSN
ncbi:MAG: hypothetical protein EOP09_06155, partial [Proteobacteria bacterium]